MDKFFKRTYVFFCDEQNINESSGRDKFDENNIGDETEDGLGDEMNVGDETNESDYINLGDVPVMPRMLWMKMYREQL